MAAFVVHIANDPDDYVAKRIADEYPDEFAHKLNDNLYLVRSDKGTADFIATQLGFDGDTAISGAVLKMNKFFAGFASRALWDWLESATNQ